MATIAQDDDLLILPDDEMATTEEVNPLDEMIVNDDIESGTTELISFDDVSDSNESLVNESENEDLMTINDENTLVSDNSDISFDLSDFGNEEPLVNSNTPEDLEEIKEEPIMIEEIAEEATSDFSLDSNDIDEVIEETASVGTMEDILGRAMKEMDARSSVILNEKDSEENHISELKEQISNLEAQVSIAEEKVSELNSEQSMISKNNKSLERMKKANVTTEIKVETSAKVHNAKRQKSVA